MTASIRTEFIGQESRAAAGLLLDRLLTMSVQFSVEPIPNRMHSNLVHGWAIAWIEPDGAGSKSADVPAPEMKDAS